MWNILDPVGQWLGVPPLALAAGNKRPVALDDILTILKDSGPVSIAVLVNDYDPEGSALTLVSATAALGTAVAAPDNTVTYTPPEGLSGFDTVTYEIADDIGQTRTAQINVTITEPQLSIALAPDNTLTVNAETGLIDVSVTDPAEFAGDYQIDTADLAGGPVNLVPPSITGIVADGQELTATEGLWIHDIAAGTPVQSWQWRRAGSDITGATSASYTVAAGDPGQGLSVRETLTDAFGQRSATSTAVGTSFVPAEDAQLLGWWDADDAATITDNAGAVSDWADKTGGVSLSQANGALQPVTGTRSQSGRNLIDFNGSAALMAGRSFPASGDMAIHMALIIDGATNAFEAILAIEGTNDFQIDANNAAQFDGRLNTAGIGDTVPLSGGPFSGALVLSAVFDRTGTGTAEIFVAGTSRGTGAYTTTIDTSAALHLMTNRSDNARGHGAVGEVIVTGDVTNRSAYHAYLATKWGVT